MKKSRIIIITVIVTLVAVSAVWIFIRIKTSASRKPTVVRIEKAQRGELIEFITAPGLIEPKTKVQIRAKVSARITELPYEEGDIVTCGSTDTNPSVPTSVLVRLDAKDLASQLLSAEANYSAQAAQLEVEKARIASQRANLAGFAARLAQAERDLERQKGLLESQDISQATFDQTQLKFDEFKSQYNSAKHTLDAAELNMVVLQHTLEAAGAKVTQAKEALSHTTITSPIDGVVTRINSEVGELVVPGIMNSAGTLIMEVADLSEMLVVAHVSEVDVGKVEVGQNVTIHVDAFPDEEFTGVVDSIALAYGTWYGTTTFATEILLEAAEEKLYWGLTAHVDIETRKHTDVLKVLSQAVLGREVDGLPLAIRENSSEVDTAKTFTTVVYRYVDDKAVVTPVKIDESDLTHTIIKSGITEEDKIVVGPYKVLENIKHDQKIQDEREAKAKKKGAKTKADVNDANNDGQS